MQMDILSFLVGSLIVMIAVALGAAVVMLMHHLDHHHKVDEEREKSTVVVRQTTPKHAELTPPTYKSYSGQQQATGAMPSRTTPVEDIPAPRPRASAEPEQSVPVVPVVPVSTTTVPAGGVHMGIPVDAVFDDRSAAAQRRGGG